MGWPLSKDVTFKLKPKGKGKVSQAELWGSDPSRPSASVSQVPQGPGAPCVPASISINFSLSLPLSLKSIDR